MKKLIVFFSVLLSVNSYSCNERYSQGQTRPLLEIVETLQSSFSYECGLKKSTKRKTTYNCKSENAEALVVIKKDPRIEDYGGKLKSIKIELLESKEFPDFNESVDNVLKSLESKGLSFICGVEKLSSRKNGNIKVKSNCSFRLNDEFLGNGKVVYKKTKPGKGKWKYVSIEFNDEDNE